MLFPRPNNNNSKDAETRDSQMDSDSDYPHTSLLGRRGLSFEDGYHPQNQEHLSTKARRHHSMGAASTGARRNRAVLGNMDEPTHGEFNRSTQESRPVATGRRRPQHLSLDHAAFIATYPSLDGLGDTGPRTSIVDYYKPFVSTNNASNNSSTRAKDTAPSVSTKTSKAHSKLHKKRSQETMPSSRASMSSISSVMTDISTTSSTSSSSSSLREPLTPIRSPNYRSTSNTKTQARTAAPKDLINLHFGEDEGEQCLSPKSPNEEDHSHPAADMLADGVTSGYSTVVAEARGQGQLTAR
ncbi:hypothetical protein BGX28_004514 [Mortierella sp. GBA30]|nr:hypothetical protein BGX28_004514 [Mortierella sp. GBA30]